MMKKYLLVILFMAQAAYAADYNVVYSTYADYNGDTIIRVVLDITPKIETLSVNGYFYVYSAKNKTFYASPIAGTAFIGSEDTINMVIDNGLSSFLISLSTDINTGTMAVFTTMNSETGIKLTLKSFDGPKN